MGEEFGVRTSVNESDRSGIGNWIRGAQKQADWTIYGFHCHESGQIGEYHGLNKLAPPEFLVDFAHWTIDQGCALFAGHGPHLLRGIEIYKGRPIFYSLGNFIFQNESVLRLPDEAYRRFGLHMIKLLGTILILDPGVVRELSQVIQYSGKAW
ncbi:MAG: hypothetical protein Ct9H300mP11_14660 [Chloroflexota bacterium]|nr:MAG: hypothetical protein Ct9H300mP11_14660 [Chloroflexota bacterium]